MIESRYCRRESRKARVLDVIFLGACCLLSASSASVAATSKSEETVDRITVDAAKVVNDTRRRQTGINLDYLIDDDRNLLLSPKRTLNDALQELGAKYLRYPGGWKSAINLWSVPPYQKSQPKLIRSMPQKWLPKGTVITNTDGSWRIDPYDFDEFMTTCRTIGGVPCLVVPYESLYWPSEGGWTPPPREQILEAAAAWVHYANSVKGYSVKYWEIGNETWLNNDVVRNSIPAKTYAKDLVEFSRRMKAEDASILVGANGDSDEWWEAVLREAAAEIDFLIVHAYPCWKWSGYDEYCRANPDILVIVRTAVNAIDKYALAHRSRLKIMMTEFAAGTFDEWDESSADLGRAVMTFDLQGQLLQCPGVYFSQFWNTHNVYGSQDGGVFDALMRDNSLSPIGRALWIWNHCLEDEMVLTTNAPLVKCFASRGLGGRLKVFLVNKDQKAREVRMKLQNSPVDTKRGGRWCFRGTGATDTHPKWEQAGSVTVKNSEVSLRLDPVSITVLSWPLSNSIP